MPVSMWGAVAVSRAPPVAASQNKHSPFSTANHWSPWTSAGDKRVNQISLWTSQSNRLHQIIPRLTRNSERERICMCVKDKNVSVCVRACVCVFCALTCRWCVLDNPLKKKRWPWMHNVSSCTVWVLLVSCLSLRKELPATLHKWPSSFQNYSQNWERVLWFLYFPLCRDERFSNQNELFECFVQDVFQLCAK